MYLAFVFIGFIIALFSPPLASLYIITALGRDFWGNAQRLNVFLISWIVLCVLFYLSHQVDIVRTLNILVGTGLSCFLLFYMLEREYQLGTIFMGLLALNSGFVALRQLLYFEEILCQYNSSVQEAIKLVGGRFAEDSQQYLAFVEMADLLRPSYLLYGSGVWLATILLCLMVGYFLFARRIPELNKISSFQTHPYIVGSLVVALLLIAFDKTAITSATLERVLDGSGRLYSPRIISTNYLLALVPLYFLQGIGVVNYKVGRWFLSSKVLCVVAIFSLIINPYIVIIITIIGLCDSWFDFRKLTKTEDLNENHSN
ncbi:MAG: hypothetical protein FWG20_05340 [Candidatus Cloacimonetes bacterium]|nr:hypothetical protein [Candidatus Cloacimonadota bacterium]